MAFRYIRNRDKELLEELAIRMKNEILTSRSSILKVAVKANININTITKFLNGGLSTTVTLTRIADAMNCDIVLIRRPKQSMLTEIPGAEEQLFKLKKRQAKYKQNERERSKSYREEFERAERNRDFASDDAD